MKQQSLVKLGSFQIPTKMQRNASKPRTDRKDHYSVDIAYYNRITQVSGTVYNTFNTCTVAKRASNTKWKYIMICYTKIL